MATPQHRNHCPRILEIYNFSRLFLGHHVFILILSEQCLRVEKKILKKNACLLCNLYGHCRWCSGLERWPRKQKVGCSNPSRNRPKSYRQVVTALLLNARQQVWVSRVLRDDHYKRMPRVTVGVARLRTSTAHWRRVPSTRQNLQPFTSNGDIQI